MATDRTEVTFAEAARRAIGEGMTHTDLIRMVLRVWSETDPAGADVASTFHLRPVVIEPDASGIGSPGVSVTWGPMIGTITAGMAAAYGAAFFEAAEASCSLSFFGKYFARAKDQEQARRIHASISQQYMKARAASLSTLFPNPNPAISASQNIDE